jgi:hypothetical protein
MGPPFVVKGYYLEQRRGEAASSDGALAPPAGPLRSRVRAAAGWEQKGVYHCLTA